MMHEAFGCSGGGSSMVWVGEGLELELVSIVFAVQATSMYRPALMQLFAAPCCNTHYAWLFELAPDVMIACMIDGSIDLAICNCLAVALRCCETTEGFSSFEVWRQQRIGD